jgi:hypothetical protein
MSIKKTVTYSLLAHINNNIEGINDLSEIFIPLVKRILFFMDKEGISKGLLNNVKCRFDKEYGLDIPFPLLKKFMSKISILKGNHQFKVHYTDGSFVMHNCSFEDYGEVLEKQNYDIKRLIQEYEKYIIAQGCDINTQPSLFEFIDTNRTELLSFLESFSDKAIKTDGFEIQAKFLSNLIYNQEAYNILKRIYLGSVISCYLECESFGQQNNLHLMLDSTVIISLLDLNNPMETDTCTRIIEMCGKLNSEIIIMDFTLEETENLLLRKADELNSAGFVEFGTDGILSSCIRRNLNKTDLQLIAGNLEKNLIELFLNRKCNYKIIKINEEHKERIKKGKIYGIIKDRFHNKDGALHDSVAIEYIYNHRQTEGVLHKKNFFDLMYWFISRDIGTANLVETSIDGFKACLTPDHLVNILWLCNPCINSKLLNDIGLTNLISNTIDEAMPKSRIFRDLNENCKKYPKVSGDELLKLAYGVATNTITTLELAEINKEAQAGKFLISLQDKIKKVEQVEEFEKNERIKEEEQHQLQMKEKEAFYEDLLSKEKSNYTRRRILDTLRLLLKETDSHIEIAISKNETDKRLYNKISKQARNEVTIVLCIYYILIGCLCYFGYKPFVENYNEAQFTYLYAIIPIIFGMGIIIVYRKKIDIHKIIEKATIRRGEKLCRRNQINIDEIKTMQEDLELMKTSNIKYESLIERIENDLITNEQIIELLKNDKSYKKILDVLMLE